MKQTITPSTNQQASRALTQFLKLPLALSISSCLLMACQSTPKATTPITQAPQNAQTQQINHNPPPTTQSTIQLPDVGTKAPEPTQPTNEFATLNNLSSLDNLLNARTMPMVENEFGTIERTGSLWSRLLHGYRIASPNNNTRIEAEKSWFLRNHGYLEALSARASRYLYHTITEAERRGIPAELALLPALESSYDPSATEGSVNGAGLWQFIPSTGRIYGLVQSSTYDGRRDIIESTRAGYDFLTTLYNQFGSWELALAAYNAGPARVQSAIDINKARGLPTDYWSLTLPKETMHYVPRFLALTQIIANMQQHNVRLPNIANHRHFRTVPVNYGISLYDVAQLTGVSVDELQLLNPALITFRVETPAPNRVVIPNRLDGSFDQKISTLIAGGGSGQMAYATPQRNDYVMAHRNFGANHNSEHELRVANSLPTTSVVITNNSTLVPTPNLSIEEREFIINQLNSTRPSVQPISQFDGNIQLLALTTGQAVLDQHRYTKRLQFSSNTINIPTPQATTAPKQPSTQATANPLPTPSTPTITAEQPVAIPDTHTVKQGEHLAGIANKYNLTIDELITLNNLVKDSKLTTGQTILLKAQTTTTSATSNNNKPSVEKTDPKPESYVVKNGDTLIGVAKAFGLTKDQLASYNNLDNNAELLRGQKLSLVPKVNKPSNTTNQSVQPTTPKPTTTTPLSKKGVYVVKEGDTLIGIANRFGTTQTDIAALNNFAIGSKLLKGQSINMPVVIANDSKAEISKPAIKTEPKVETPKADNKTDTNIRYTVQAGDTLIGLANKYGISRGELASTNGLKDNDQLKIGMTLTIPNKLASSTNPIPAVKLLKDTEIYQVQAGDSLIGLAKRYEVAVEDLAKTNNLTTTTLLKTGQTIKVPKLTISYTVKRGDSLIGLAKRYAISADELAKMNGLKPTDTLAIGQHLIVPNRQ